jgi:hypothetical protein
MSTAELTDHMISMLEMALTDNSYMAEWYFDKKENPVTFISEDDGLEEEEELKQIILDERPAGLLIRIEDDRGKIVWLPKSHFELV